MGKVHLQNDKIAVEVSALGAELQSLRRLSDGSEWLWQGDAAFWTGRAPLLFPIVGQAPEGEVELDGKRFAMRSHGFARHSTFELLSHDDRSARFSLQSNDEISAIYPYKFRLTVDFGLLETVLTTKVTVENLDHRPMPFQFGFHPAFAYPLPQAQGADHSVHFLDHAPQNMRRLADGLMAREVLAPPALDGIIPVNPKDYLADAMVFPDLKSQKIRYQGAGSSLLMQVENLPDFALWQKPNAPFLCLEPWHGMAPYPDLGKALAARPNAITLPAGEQREFVMSLTIEA